MAKKLAPMHPGEVLREEFLVPLGLSPGALAKACGLPRTRIERIAAETIGVSADTALRLSKALSTTPMLWLNLQTDYDIEIARRDLGSSLDRIVPVNDNLLRRRREGSRRSRTGACKTNLPDAPQRKAEASERGKGRRCH